MQRYESAAYVMTPAVIFPSSLTGFPSASSGALIERVCSAVAARMKRAASAKCMPGHILSVHADEFKVPECGRGVAYRRPYPNAIDAGSSTSGLSWPSFRNRSGMNDSGSG